MTRQLTLLPDPIDEAFVEFHWAHPEVYDALVVMARRLKARGHRRISLRDLFGVLRYEAALRGVADADGFKLNNSYTSRYARHIALNEPDLADLFATRVLASEREQAA